MPPTDPKQTSQATALHEHAWVIIETGSNQAYILTSNRRRYAVGASHLLKRLATWVDEEVAAHSQSASITRVVVTSSKALLLVPDRQIGVDIVHGVTQRALLEAPGLDVWGYVEEGHEPNAGMKERLSALHTAHAEQRWRRAQPVARAPMAPFLDACAFTGRAAERRLRRADELVSVSSQADAIITAAKQAPQSLRDQLVEPPRLPAGMTVPHEPLGVETKEIQGAVADSDDGDELLNAGWIAVVHADGNRVGDVVSSISSVDDLTLFSVGLGWATAWALRSAVARVIENSKAQDAEAPKHWLLPLVVGGDDVTLVCDARYAVTLTREYLTYFERYTSQILGSTAGQRIAQWTVAGLGRRYLTASAGVAIVKPKFPFSSAYQLAEMLVHEAKRHVKDEKHCAEDRSSYDLHILRDSVLSDLAQMRPTSGSARLNLVATPLLAPRGVEAPRGSSAWVEAHEDQPVIEQVESLLRGESTLSASEIRRLRTAMAQGTTMGAVRERLAARAVDAGSDPFRLADERRGGYQLTRWPVVLDMLDIHNGTVVGRRGAK